MSDVFGRRTNLVAIIIAGALFFTALGFFVATGIDRPSELKAEGLWTDGNGLTPELRDIPSFAPIGPPACGGGGSRASPPDCR